MTKINRIKEVLEEKGKTGVWLSQTLGKDPATVSRWCNNHIQPPLATLDKVAKLLDINRQELLEKSK